MWGWRLPKYTENHTCIEVGVSDQLLKSVGLSKRKRWSFSLSINLQIDALRPFNFHEFTNWNGPRSTALVDLTTTNCTNKIFLAFLSKWALFRKKKMLVVHFLFIWNFETLYSYYVSNISPFKGIKA